MYVDYEEKKQVFEKIACFLWKRYCYNTAHF